MLAVLGASLDLTQRSSSVVTSIETPHSISVVGFMLGRFFSVVIIEINHFTADRFRIDGEWSLACMNS